MFVHESDENPIDIKLLLHHGPYECRVGVFADAMFSIIIGFNVKRHRVTSPLNLIFWVLDLPINGSNLFEPLQL